MREDLMSGYALPVIPKRFLDFATVPVGGTQEIILADRLPLIDCREVALEVRVHSHSLTGSNQIDIRVYPQSWTDEDPGLLFLAASTSPVSIVAATTSPALLSAGLSMLGSAAIAAMARVTAFATRAGAGTMTAALSLEFASKES